MGNSRGYSSFFILDYLLLKTILDGKQPSIQDDLQRKKTEVLNPKLDFDMKD